jgi:ribosomal protein S17E
MGRIKSLMVKRAAKQLLVGENVFTDKFENNKTIVLTEDELKKYPNVYKYLLKNKGLLLKRLD